MLSHKSVAILFHLLCSTNVVSFTAVTNVFRSRPTEGVLYARSRRVSESSGPKPPSNTSSISKKVSVSLADWAASTSNGSPTALSPESSTLNVDDDSIDSTSASTFTPFSSKEDNIIISRRERQKARLAAESAKQQVTLSIIQSIQSILKEKNFVVPSLISQIQELIRSATPSSGSVMTTTSGGIKALLLQSSTVKQYSLAWVGSDECLTHVGTGLHKVPLARLEEVFLSLGPKRSWVLYEVIRIIGPFPNVRNTLQGKVTDVSPKIRAPNSSVSTTNGWDVLIQYDSMVDGTGREILAGKAENIRNVKLEVLFVDENAMVCVIPSADDGIKPIEDGKNMLLFLKENDMEARLRSLRVSNNS